MATKKKQDQQDNEEDTSPVCPKCGIVLWRHSYPKETCPNQEKSQPA